MNGQNKSRSKRCSFISWTPGPSVCSRKSFKIKIVLFLLCFIATRGNHHLFIYYSCRPRWHPVNYGKWNGSGLGHVFHSGSMFVFSLNAANFVLLCLVQLSPQKTSTLSLLLKSHVLPISVVPPCWALTAILASASLKTRDAEAVPEKKRRRRVNLNACAINFHYRLCKRLPENLEAINNPGQQLIIRISQKPRLAQKAIWTGKISLIG